MPNELIEKLADIEHERWSSWMKYMFGKGKFDDNDGTVTWTMLAWETERWQRQMNTPYSDLSEKEKDSDRIEVHKTLGALIEYLISIMKSQD